MRIVVGGSMTFAKEQLEVKRGLEELGHEVSVTEDIDVYLDNPLTKDNFDEELKACLENDIVRSFFNKIKETDAYVVVNKEKRGIKGYLGTSVLMEIGLAYHLGKKIFLLEEIDKSQGCALEIAIINPVILDGDLSRVDKCLNKSLDGMKIVICGSNVFREKMIEFKKKINDRGGVGIIHPDYEAFARGERREVWERIQENHAAAKRENGYIAWYHDAIVGADAILVLNYDKDGIKNYVGGNTLMEIGFAHTNGKKVFLMNPVPKEVSYFDEIEAMYDKVLNEDLSRIDKFKSGSGTFLKQIADRACEIQEEIGLTFDDVLNKFTQEVGELNDAVQKRRGRFCKTKALNDDNLKDELGDVMFNLISICNGMNINPNELPLLAKNTLDKFEERKELYKENLR